MNPHSRPAHARPEAAAGQIHFAKREEFFGPLGVTNIRTFVDPEQPTRVGVLMDVPDMGAVMAAIESDDAPGMNRTCARGLGNRCSIH